jgi:hypothetical protein
MPSRRTFLTAAGLIPELLRATGLAPASNRLDPRGRIHIPIGMPDTPDTLKTFVEAEGSFSPGFGTCGVYFWVYDRAANRLLASTMDDAQCRHGLHQDGFLIPWIEWSAGHIGVRLEICQVERKVSNEKAHVVAARVQLRNTGEGQRQFTLYAAIRPLGPAGFDINEIAVNGLDALLIEGRTALLGSQRATNGGVLDQDAIGDLAMSGQRPAGAHSKSAAGDCSGALLYDLELAPGEAREYSFVCPVLPGRRAARHRWADLGQEAMVDVAPLYGANGLLQPDPGLDYYRALSVPELFKQAEAFWRELTGRIEISVPDARWREAAHAILGHASLCMNEGAPDVAVANYNVFNRDGSYVANIFQKSGLFSLAESALDYFLANPFNGRAYPEADNPGQILWALGQQWLFARDRSWVARIYPSAAKIAAMIEYYRTTRGPHWVNAKSLNFGDALPPELRSELKPGRCDGQHPEYTEAFDIAGLRAAAMLAGQVGRLEDASKWTALAERLFAKYRDRFGSKLTSEYGSYSVLWPCNLFSYSSSEARTQFAQIGARKPESWRYFPLATAHQGLLAGNREAGHATLALHLDHEQMRGWFAFDEGGGSDSGGWHRVRTTWPHNKEKPGENLSVAMPHGWAIAEFWLLMRDSLAHEDGDRLVLLPGVAPAWFRDPAGMSVTRLRTHFGNFGFEYRPSAASAVMRLTDTARPPGGYALRLPPGLATSVRADGHSMVSQPEGQWNLPSSARDVTIVFAI